MSTLCLAIAFSLTPVQALLFFLAGASVGTCTALLGLMVNLALPKLDAPNDTVVVKQSASVLVTMFGSWALLAVLGFGYVFVFSRLGETAGLLIAAGICALLNLVLWRLLATVGIKLFREL